MVRRRPIEERWSAENLSMIGGVPWRANDQDEAMDGEKLRIVEASGPSAGPAMPTAEGTSSGLPQPRNVGIRRSDLEKYGYTSGCAGCASVIRGVAPARQSKHSAACRARLEKELKEDARVKKA